MESQRKQVPKPSCPQRDEDERDCIMMMIINLIIIIMILRNCSERAGLRFIFHDLLDYHLYLLLLRCDY